MKLNGEISAIQKCISNRLNLKAIGDLRLAGVIGDAPSQYSKSPALWNASFELVEMKALYVPLDVAENQLKELMSAFRDCERLMGVNVTVPHKLNVMEYLDDLAPGASRIGAVNTILRTDNGRLVGYNTDGEGFVESILKPQPDQSRSFIQSLDGIDVLLLGAGGSARAVAFHVAALLNNGRLVICNRTIEHARALSQELRQAGYSAEAVGEGELARCALSVGLIINTTTKGQGSVGKLSMERYSALAPANTLFSDPAEQPERSLGTRAEQFCESEIENNNSASFALASRIPTQVGFYDLIYFPDETLFLRHGRETGHRTMNGKAMIVNQAVIAFCERICQREIVARGLDTSVTKKLVLEAMYKAW